MRILAAFLLFLTLGGAAQKPVREPGFRVDAAAGVVGGESLPSFQAQGIAGLRYKQFFAGLGGGIDHYQQKSLPLFLHLQASWKRVGSTPFAFASGGWNHPKAVTEEQKANSRFERGYYYDAGIGYRIRFTPRFGLYMAAGLTGKSYDEYRMEWIACPGGCRDIPLSQLKYRLSRFGLKAGVSLN